MFLKISPKMKNRTAVTVMWLGVICFSLDIFGYLNHGWLGLIPSMITGLWHLGQFAQKNNLKVIETALLNLDGIYDGRRFIGKEAKVVVTERKNNPTLGEPIYFEQLCKTNKGQWFKFNFATNAGSGVCFDLDVTSLDGSQAMEWLEKYPRLYVKHFCEPKIA